MKRLLAACLALFSPSMIAPARAQDPFFCTTNCGAILREAELEHERIMARLVRAELASGELERLLALGTAACAAPAGPVRGGTLRKKDEGHREVIDLELDGRSLTMIRLSDRNCSGLDLNLYAQRPRWHRLSSHRFSFHIPSAGEILVDRDEYAVFLEEKDAWLAFQLVAAPKR